MNLSESVWYIEQVDYSSELHTPTWLTETMKTEFSILTGIVLAKFAGAHCRCSFVRLLEDDTESNQI